MRAVMKNDPTPNSANGEEISLEDIDKILEKEDPALKKNLEQMRSVESDKNVEIQTAVADETLAAAEKSGAKVFGFLAKIKTRLKGRLSLWRVRLRNRLIQFSHDALIFLKTRPKEFALYSFVVVKTLVKLVIHPFVAFYAADRIRKVMVLTFISIIFGSLWVLRANFRGIWIPYLTEPVLTSLAEEADWVDKFDPKASGQSFYDVFPQDRHEFLLKKIKVNLKRASMYENPMGAFEVIVLVDSEDTAIEVRDRQTELNDIVQRVMEEQTFDSLDTKIGKDHLKAQIKSELNNKLTQGFVKDISFKTFVIKP